MEFSDLGAAEQTGTLSRQPIGSLVTLIRRAQTPQQYHQLALAFALRGEVVLWLHTLERAKRTLCRSESLAAFIGLHFASEALVPADRLVQPHIGTQRLTFLTQLAYKTSGTERTRVLGMIGEGTGTVSLLPQSSREADLTPHR